MTTKRYRGAVLRNLRQIRESLSVSRQQLADDTGVDYAFLWRLERCDNGAGYETARSIATRLGVTVDDLTREEVTV